MHGLYGNGYGAWLLSPSWEFYTGGPVKQELMVHHQNLILNMYHGGQFGSATATASPASWQKLYGPNLVYVNVGRRRRGHLGCARAGRRRARRCGRIAG